MSESSATVPRPRLFYTEPTGSTSATCGRLPPPGCRGAHDLPARRRGTRMWLPFYEQMAASVGLRRARAPRLRRDRGARVAHGLRRPRPPLSRLLRRAGSRPFPPGRLSVGGWIAADVAVFYPGASRQPHVIAPAGVCARQAAHRPLRRCRRSASHLPLQRPGGRAPRLPARRHEPRRHRARLRRDDQLRRLAWARRTTTRSCRGDSRGYGCPTLLVGAGTSWIVPNEHVDRYAERGAGRARPPHPRDGHGAVHQEPERAAQEIVSFIANGTLMNNSCSSTRSTFMPYPFGPASSRSQSALVTIPNSHYDPWWSAAASTPTTSIRRRSQHGQFGRRRCQRAPPNVGTCNSPPSIASCDYRADELDPSASSATPSPPTSPAPGGRRGDDAGRSHWAVGSSPGSCAERG